MAGPIAARLNSPKSQPVIAMHQGGGTRATLLAVPQQGHDSAGPSLRQVRLAADPVHGLLYLINYIDRTNVGFAALTMNADLGFEPAFSVSARASSYVGYTLFQVPANVILDRIGARRWIF